MFKNHFGIFSIRSEAGGIMVPIKAEEMLALGHIFERKEQKYLLNEKQSRALVQLMTENMHRDRYYRSAIRNIYYDTPDYRLIRRSLEKPSYKEKLRLRCYGDVSEENSVFLEMKKKYKGIVYKRRVELSEKEAVQYMADRTARLDAGQIGREIDYFKDFYAVLRPTLFLSYDRLAWHSVDTDLRVTLDWDIRYRTWDLDLTAGADGTPLLEPGQALLEIKTSMAMPLWFAQFLSSQQIRQCSFSKYGSAYLRLLQDNKIEIRGLYYA